MSKTAKVILIIALVLGLLLLTILGIGGYLIYKYVKDYNGNTNTEPVVISNTWELSSSLESFSASEFDNFVAKHKKELEEDSSSSVLGLGLAEGGAFEDGVVMSIDADAAAPTEKSSDEEGITNIQEQGVDEGDIVKAYGDYLVVLRRGRVFTIQVKDGDEELLEPIYKSDAYPKGFTNGTWYDEMLIHDNQVIVVGYSYSVSATEIGIFEIADDGKITHKDSYYIDSNDYYSSRNYASRLVDNELIFYMPYYLFDWDYIDDEYRPVSNLPQIKKWKNNNELTKGKNIIEKNDIYKPIQDTDTPTLHMVVTCDLDSADFDCSSQAILGPYSRNFYVSPNAVYVWVYDYDYSYYYDEEDVDDEEEVEEPNAYVYAMPLDEEGVGVIRAYGSPLDQFSFKESDDNYLNVLVQDQGFGDAMWNPEYADSNLSLLRFPTGEFGKNPKALSANYYRTLPSLEGYGMQNRFVDDYLLYGSGSSWWDEEDDLDPLYVVNYKNRGKVQNIDLNSSVDRIEVLDNDNAVVVGGDDEDLQFNWISLSEDAKLASTNTLEDAVQGETRSHGFFYSASQGVLGLPIKDIGEGYEQLWYGSAEIIFYDVDTDKKEFSKLGTLASSSSSNDEYSFVDDSCEYSCTDWYGNSRPIFLGDRIFALLGYELVEGEVDSGDIKEKGRTHCFSDL